MKLDLPVQQFLDLNIRELEFLKALNIVDQRRYMRLLIDINFLRFGQPGPAVHSVHDRSVTVAGGEIRCRIYRPSDEAMLPAHLTLHGGGWWQGSIDDLICDALARQRCNEGHLVVVAVEYRLAPEHPYPTGLNDAFAAFKWLAENAKQLGVDADNVSIGGSSAGGNLAAALAIKLRDSGGAQPRLQLLEVPALDLTLNTSQNAAAGTGSQDMDDELGVAVDRYIADPRQCREPLASPLLADNLAGLPPAVIFTAEHDVLHVDGQQYAARLNAAGVPARVVPHAGALHGSAMLTRSWQPAAAWQSEAAEVLRSVHWDRAEIKTAV